MRAACWSRPAAQVIAVCSSMGQKKSVGGGSHTTTRKPPPLPVMAMLQLHWRIPPRAHQQISAKLLILSHRHKTNAYVHSFGQPTLTPWKVPTPLTTIAWYESPLPLALLLQGETFPRRGKKHLVVISLPFFTPLFPLRSIPLVRTKTNSGWKIVALHHTDPLCSWCWSETPKIRHQGQVGVTDKLRPTPHLVCPNIDSLCANVWGSVLKGGVLRVEGVCLGVHWACVFLVWVLWMAGVCYRVELLVSLIEIKFGVVIWPCLFDSVVTLWVKYCMAVTGLIA